MVVANPPFPLLSSLCTGTVGLLAKIFLRLCTNVRVHNLPVLLEAIHRRPAGVPLITVSNHTSTLDDPLIFGILPLATLFNARAMRWSLGAREILFVNPLYRLFFSAGKVLPIVRGDGIYQPAMNTAVDLAKRGDWIHIFPEGRVFADSSSLLCTRLKWGVSRVVLESRQPPILLPIIHQGLEKIKPSNQFLPHLSSNNPLTITVGDPIDTTPLWLPRPHEQQPPDLDRRRSEIASFIAAHMRKQYNRIC